jgi:hypothetical protein
MNVKNETWESFYVICRLEVGVIDIVFLIDICLWIKDVQLRCLITRLIVPGVAEKIAATKEMHILTLAGNTVGIDAAKAIGMFSHLILPVSYLIPVLSCLILTNFLI